MLPYTFTYIAHIWCRVDYFYVLPYSVRSFPAAVAWQDCVSGARQAANAVLPASGTQMVLGLVEQGALTMLLLTGT